MSATDREIISLIDHAVLGADATREDVLAACATAAELGVASVCVHPRWVSAAAKALRGSGVITGTVIGFPMGANTAETKAFETRDAVANGADELDMVMAITAFKSGDLAEVKADIAAVVGAAYSADMEEPVVKVILETCYLTDAEKRLAVELAVEAGADFVKTSTGLGPGGATVEDVKLLREAAPEGVGVKASGGIRTAEDALAMVEAGANRIGTSSTRAIVQELGLL
jgi:deoxyribose-phosphate aldolase